MSDSRARLREQIFNEAASLAGEERQRVLDDRCRADPELRDEIEALLRHDHAAPAHFLEGDAGGVDHLTEGRSIGPYRIVRELGRGGQGVVYLARDTRLPRQVALKVLDSGSVATRDQLLRFRREAEVASKLDHPGICSVYEAGVHGDAAYIAMHYVDGETLSRKIATAKHGEGGEGGPSCVLISESAEESDEAAREESTPTPSTHRTTRAELMAVVQVFEKAARALHVAHEAGVIHRDIKPGNIMVTAAGEPVLLDFGLARDLEIDAEGLTRSGDVFGTPAYMSPEQLTRQGIRIDRRTDVYSLGVALYESLTLERPFHAPTREGLYQAILTKEPADPRAMNPAIPGDLKVVLDTAMEKDRDRRYQTALDFAEDLRRVRSLEPILAKPVGRLVRLQRWGQRNPALAASATGLFAVLAIGLAVALFLLGQRDRALENVTSERNEKEAARSSLAASVSDYDRLGDLSRLQRLRAEADRLWPADPSNAPAMKAWVEQGAALAERLDGHRTLLEELRKSGVKVLPDSRPDESRPADSRPTWRFTLDAAQFKHDTTAKLVADLTTFVDPDPHKGLLADVRARLAFAETVERETLLRYEAAWKRATESIAASPKYHGLTIRPQLGLIPIDQDPKSGLWEFVHLQTTGPGAEPVPKRDKDGNLIVTESMGLVFVLIPGGSFRMGAIRPEEDQAPTDPNIDPDAIDIESPVNEVLLDPFFMSKYELTQGQWLRITGTNPSSYGPGLVLGGKLVDLRHPVEQVSWEDCDSWFTRLGIILPTEAQWEYAARGGTSTPWWTGLGKDGLANAANLFDASARPNTRIVRVQYESWDDGYTVHAPVGSFAPNPFGLYDVLGNVCEWCRDWFRHYSVPVDPGDGLRRYRAPRLQRGEAPHRVARGGNYTDNSASARSATRFSDPPHARIFDLGVRPARRPDP